MPKGRRNGECSPTGIETCQHMFYREDSASVEMEEYRPTGIETVNECSFFWARDCVEMGNAARLGLKQEMGS